MTHRSAHQSTLLTCLWCSLCALLVLVIWSLGWFDSLESYHEDGAIRNGRKPGIDSKIVVVAIDPASMHSESLGKPPWRPVAYAKLLRRLNELGARHVAFDVLLEHFFDENDKQLCDAIRRSRATVTLGCQWAASRHADAVEERWTFPARQLRQTKQLTTGRPPDVGFINFPLEDERIRSTWLSRPHPIDDGQVIPSFAAAISLRHNAAPSRHGQTSQGRLADQNDGRPIRIHYVGQPNSFRTVNVLEVMGETPHFQLQEWMTGATVIIGATAPEFHDLHDTPMHHRAFGTGRMSGAEIHANIVNMLQQPDLPQRATATLSTIWMLTWCLLYLALLSCSRPVYSLIALLVCVLGLSAGSQQIYSWCLVLLPVWAPAIALGSMWAGTVVIRWMTVDRQQRKMRDLFSRCLHESVVSELMAGPNQPTLSGQIRDVTVFFCDIRGFTNLSEQLQPEQVVDWLREYFEAMCRVIYAHNGAVDKFIGDAIMAFFGTPQEDPLHAERAVSCALAMRRELSKLNQRWQGQGIQPIDIGFGVSTGPVVAGMLGSTRKMEYTVIGDTVNIASRLESLNKELGTSILVSQRTKEAISDRHLLQDRGKVTVRGKTEPLHVYSVESGERVDENPSIAKTTEVSRLRPHELEHPIETLKS